MTPPDFRPPRKDDFSGLLIVAGLMMVVLIAFGITPAVMPARV